MIHSIEERTDLKGKRVLVRADINVPIQDGKVADSLRIDLALQTIQYITNQGGRVILISHMSDVAGSLAPVAEYLQKKIPLHFLLGVAGPSAQKAAHHLSDGEVLLLENLRHDAREEKNDPEFAKELASLADIYVNDGFPVAHRSHASIVGVPKLLPSYAGFQFFKELNGLTPALSPESPSIAIIGGAKLITKISLIQALLKKYDKVFMGGALANDLYVAKGYEIGKSLVSGTGHATNLLENPKIILPMRVIVSGPLGARETRASEVGKEETISDIAPSSIRELKPFLEKASSTLWNGPMGNFEKGFRQGTDVLAEMIASSPGKKIIGGGDTLSSIQNLGLSEKFTFISSAGGAMLDFLANGTLPGIEALDNRS
ncbi:phosphoglycerate kinase [Candidatus Kaiserbacteria bacterium RIFCSPHIGHO2_01_FULL_48_10]|uniref:Phosphoglycerate kinase n=1 Tax=Candidatus Kaiserbacteria bacterium RIFCSPHIGHO2_01_FULL_48_10 TaxID=1798476 RepID=A0A1F6C4W3_9BACT|nr:MAG: phosphoglycerate kinase [Candidatus Kaiserbacteria bacterium RIFCSPHIGHO2_01_FULL_48_10]